jgi:hypothetical protein
LHIDTFSLVRRDPAGAPVETMIEERTDWGVETVQARRIGRLYQR